MILLHRAGRQRVDARRRGQAAVLGDHRGLRVLGQHQPRVHARILSEEGRQALGAARVEQAIGPPLGNRPHLGGGHGEEIAGEADRRTVEVPARFDPSVGQDHRVVDRRGELRLGHPAGMRHGVTSGAVHLRRAAQGIGVLDTGVVVAVAGDDRRALEQSVHVGGAGRLAGMRAKRDQVRREGSIGAQKRLDRHRRGHVGDGQEHPEVLDRKRQHAEDPVGAVDQRQALLRRQRQRLDPGGGKRLARGEPPTIRPEHLSLAEQRQRAVGQGREVAAGTE